jgi:hypothetical protein
MPNTYHKFCPNVFLAQCTEAHEKGETILVETKYGKENECIVFNLIAQKGEFWYYSIVRSDGFNTQEWAKRRADRLNTASANAETKSNAYYAAADEGRDFLVLAEPIKIGHHSEKRHRALIQRNHDRMDKMLEFSRKAETYDQRASYWEGRANDINLSMPESLKYFEFEVEKSEKKHADLKTGVVKPSHSYSLTYAKKEVNEARKKFEIAKLLWE